MKTILTATALATILATQTVNAEIVESTHVEDTMQTEDVVAGAGLGVWAAATLASWAAPAAVAHSSGMAILWSGTGYVAGTIGLGAATIAALPIIATVGAATATGAVVYKNRDSISEFGGNIYDEYFGDE